MRNRWQAVATPAEITEAFLASTRDLLMELNKQPDQFFFFFKESLIAFTLSRVWR